MKRPNVILNEIYTIAETCDQLGIDRRTLRRWTVAGSITSHIRTSDGRIVYTGADIHKCFHQII